MNGHRNRPSDVPKEDRALTDMALDQTLDIRHRIFRNRLVVKLAHPARDDRAISFLSGSIGRRAGTPERSRNTGRNTKIGLPELMDPLPAYHMHLLIGFSAPVIRETRGQILTAEDTGKRAVTVLQQPGR